MKLTGKRIYRTLQHRLIWWLILSYVIGALSPQLGLWIRDASGPLGSSGWPLKIMLGLLLFNAGLGLDQRHLRYFARGWGVLAAATVGSAIIPAFYGLVVGLVIGPWEQLSSCQAVVTGLMLVAAMPVAGSSTAWAQNAEGNMALSLALVVISTVLSPLTVPVVLEVASQVLSSESGAQFRVIGANVGPVFITIWVVLPAVAGVASHRLIGKKAIDRAKPYLKLANLLILLLLNYSNASLALPDVVASPNLQVLSVVAISALGMAAVSFASAQLLAGSFGVDEPQRISMFFGMGMKNTGAALVFVSIAIPDPEIVLLSIIFCTLSQHLVAAAVDRLVVYRNNPRDSREEGEERRLES